MSHAYIFTSAPSICHSVIATVFLLISSLAQSTKAMADDDDNSSATSSDSSDDDFLTTLHPEVGDREALVRRKLLQNFYGKSALPDEDASAPATAHRSSSGTSSSRRNHANKPVLDGATTDDLDSPAFDPVQHAVQHIRSSTTHELLETEEKLALSVRTLDSTMQTLVYENYSRFIDATDAVRS